MPVRMAPGVLTRSSPRAMPVVAVRPRPWSRARRWLRAAVTWFDPGRCRRSARRRDPARGQRPELAAGSGRRSPGSTPGDADGPHAGAIPPAANVPSSPPAPGGGHLVRPRAMPAIRTSAAPGVRLAIDAGPHGPGRGHRVEPPGAVTWFDPGRCRRSRSGSGAALNSPPAPGGGHRVRAPGDADGPDGGAVPAVVTWFDPGRWRRSARRPPRA